MRPCAEKASARYDDSNQVLLPLVVTVTGVIVAEEVWPNVKEFGFAEIVKSGGCVTATVTMAEWERELLVPVTLTV